MKTSSCQTEALRLQLAARDNEAENLTQTTQVQEREIAAAKRDARTKQELIHNMEGTLHKANGTIEQQESMLKETSDKLSESQMDNITLRTTVETLRSAIKSSAEKYKEHLAELVQCQDKTVSTLKREHAAHTHSIERANLDLQRTNSELETDMSRLQREKQSADQRCLVLERLISEKEKEYKVQIKLLTDRTLEAEAQVDNSVSTQHDLKKNVAWCEEKLREMTDKYNQMTAEHSRAIEKLQSEFGIVEQENESLTNQVSMLQDRMESIRQEYDKENEKLMVELDQKMQHAKIECEELKVLKSSEMLKAKEARTMLEKAVALHQSTIDGMKTDFKTTCIELENQVSDERNISQVSSSKMSA